MVSGGKGTRAEISELEEYWAITVFFDSGFTTYLVPPNSVVVGNGIEIKKSKKKKTTTTTDKGK